MNLWERQDEAPWLAMKPVNANDQSRGSEGNGDGSGQPTLTPGPSSPNTPTKGRLRLENDATNDGGDDGEVEVEHDFGDLGDLGDDWDDEAQAELDAFLEGSSDGGSEAGTRYVYIQTPNSKLQPQISNLIPRTSYDQVVSHSGGKAYWDSTRSREETPGTPSKKRVRYADEEHLPLESYKDPSPNQ